MKALLGFLLVFSGFAMAGPYDLPDADGFMALRRKALECLQGEGDAGKKLVTYYEDTFFKKLPKKIDTATAAFGKAFLAYTKVQKFCKAGCTKELGYQRPEKGRHDENSPFLGAKAKVMKDFLEYAKKHGAIARFANALYHRNPSCPGEGGARKGPEVEGDEDSPTMQIIPEKFAAESKKLAAKMLEDRLKASLPSDGKALTQAEAGSETPNWILPGVTYTHDISNPWNDWTTSILFKPQGETLKVNGAKHFMPGEIILMHELGHVERTFPGASELKSSTNPFTTTMEEVGPTMDHVLAMTEILTKLDPKEKVDVTIPTGEKKTPLNLGTVATKLRAIMTKAKVSTPEEALMTADGLALVKESFDDKVCPFADKGPGTGGSREIDQPFRNERTEPVVPITH